MKTYIGERTDEGCTVSVESVDRLGRRHVRPLSPRLDLWNHSPSGLEWGFGGSGPAQLALALLADHLGDDEAASRLHQAFKWQLVAHLPRERWTLTSDQLQAAVDEIARTRTSPVGPARAEGPER